MVDELVNPYIAGAPVTEARMFFGREDVFDWIQNSLVGKYADHILVIHGQRRVGKTSVLKQLGNRLPQRYIPVFFDLQGRTHTTLDRFLWWLAREIVRVLKQERGMEIPVPEKDAFSADPEYFESHFLGNLLPMLDSGSLLLTFDEFDNLEESEIKETLARPLIDYLRRLMGRQGLNFIFSIGSSGRKLENMQADYTDFFKTALYKKISFLNEEQTHNLITRPVEGVLEYDRHAVNRIHKVAGGHPYFTQLTCHELFARCQQTDQRHIRENDVEAILDDVVERGTVNLKFVWDEASDIEKWTLASLAVLDKADSRTLNDCLLKQRVRFSESDLTSSLLHLREKDILTPENRFVIHLLRLWLQKNRPIEQVREELTEVNPIANRYIEIGQEFRNSGQYQKAIESFQEALAVSAGNIQAQVHIALVFMDQKDYDKAVTEFEKALVIDDEDVTARSGLCEAHLALGDAAMQKGRPREAAQSYQRVLAINEEHTEARQRMAEISRQRAEKAWSSGRDEEALSSFTEALRFTPEDPTLITRVEQFREEKKAKILAILLAGSEKEALAKNWDGAVRSLEEALTLSPDDETISRKLADAKAAQAKEGALSAIYVEAQRAYTGKDYDQAVNLFKKIILEDENYRDASRLLTQSIEFRRTAPKWWQRKAAPAVKHAPLPRSRPRVSPKKIGLIGAVSLLVLGLAGGLFWLAKNGLPAIFIPAADKTSSASPPPTGTPDPRVLNPANQHRYLFLNSDRTWHEARNYCALQGGYLATIQDAAENEFVYQLTSGSNSVWLGATDEAEEGVWSWVTGEPWTYKNWAEGEPNNASEEDARGENHMSFLWPEAPSYWNDVPAASEQPFVCEWGPAESDLDPDIQAKLDTIQNTAPIRQTNFDAWEFRDSPENAKLENGKLVLLSENQEPVGVSFDVLPSDNFAVEFEFRVSGSGPDGCYFFADTSDATDESFKSIGAYFDSTSQSHLNYYEHPDQWSSIADVSYENMEPNKVTLIVHGGTNTVFVNGILTFDVPNPDGNTVYSRHSFSAEGNNACEFDNYRLWDFREMDPAIITAFDAISREEPLYQTSFDTWDFGNLAKYASIEDGKLIIASDNQEGPIVNLNNHASDKFAIQYDLRILESGRQDATCHFLTQNDIKKAWSESWRAIDAQFSDGGALLGRWTKTEITDFLSASDLFFSKASTVTLFIIEDQITAFIDGRIIFTTRDPDGSVVYTQHALAAYGGNVCEYDNYKYWDLSGVEFSGSTETPTPAPATSAAQGPAWVTEFAEPILAAINGQPPHVQDDIGTATTPWLNYHDGAQFKRIDGEMVTSDSNYSWKMWYTDFVIELDYRFLPSAARDESWTILFRGSEGFTFSRNGDINVNRYLQQGESLARVAEPAGSVNHVLILVKDEEVALFINDQPVYYGDLPSGFKNGEASFGFGANIAYDNFKIWNLNDLP